MRVTCGKLTEGIRRDKISVKMEDRRRVTTRSTIPSTTLPLLPSLIELSLELRLKINENNEKNIFRTFVRI